MIHDVLSYIIYLFLFFWPCIARHMHKMPSTMREKLKKTVLVIQGRRTPCTLRCARCLPHLSLLRTGRFAELHTVRLGCRSQGQFPERPLPPSDAEERLACREEGSFICRKRGARIVPPTYPFPLHRLLSTHLTKSCFEGSLTTGSHACLCRFIAQHTASPQRLLTNSM